MREALPSAPVMTTSGPLGFAPVAVNWIDHPAIATRLRISEKAVVQHTSHAYDVLGLASNRPGACANCSVRSAATVGRKSACNLFSSY